MQLAIYLSPELAARVRRGDIPEDIQRALHSLRIGIKPEHPETSSQMLNTSFVADVTEAETVSKAIAQLQQCAGVDTVYLKPDVEPPG